jgi:integrase
MSINCSLLDCVSGPQMTSSATNVDLDANSSSSGGTADANAAISKRIADIVAAEGKSKSTWCKIHWAEATFRRWTSSPVDLRFLNPVAINSVVPKFILEIRKEDGGSYPPNTLYDLVIYLQQAISLTQKTTYNFLEDPQFAAIKLVLDAEMKRLRSCGIGVMKKQVDVINESCENSMWANNILGGDNPHQLLHTMIYLLGVNLVLRGRLEHRQLQWNNFEMRENVIVCRENVSKCNAGGIKGRKMRGKIVEIHKNTTDTLRCPILLFKKYSSLCPSDRDPDSPFYLTPLKNFSATTWYSKVPVGINTIAKATTTLMQRANVEGFFTNHSLRRTAITRMYRTIMGLMKSAFLKHPVIAPLLYVNTR